MLFSEIYGSYFNTVAAVLTEAGEKAVSEKRIAEIMAEKAFAESTLSIPAALKSGEWPLLDSEMRSVLHHAPTMPLSDLQKRWLKAVSLDRRISLFEPDISGLEDVEPLFGENTFVFFDRYNDGDPYDDPNYIACFRTVLRAIREGKRLRMRYRGHTGLRHSHVCTPHKLEYSAKDDKFRLITVGRGRPAAINMARVRSCEILEPAELPPAEMGEEEKCGLELLLRDERNALERVLLHFSHFEKETEKLDAGLYRIFLRYDKDDETELLIRVLSFGPVLEVRAPESFRELVVERLRRQQSLA